MQCHHKSFSRLPSIDEANWELMAIETLESSVSDSNNIVGVSRCNKVVRPRSPHEDLNKVLVGHDDFQGKLFKPLACFSVQNVLALCNNPLVSFSKANIAVDLNGEPL